MDSTARQYEISIFQASGSCDIPSSEVHMEIAGDFEAFYKMVENWTGAFGQLSHSREPKFWMQVGLADTNVFCSEEEIILSLLYCCDQPGITVRELSYQGNRYREIRDIRFLRGYDDEVNDGFCTHSVWLSAKKDGRDIQVYFFGPYIRDFNYETVKISRYPFSRGIVEVKENQRYAGAFYYTEWYTDEEDPFPMPIWAAEYVHVFLEISEKYILFSALLDGKLHKKISRDEECVIFYSVRMDDGILLTRNRFWSLDMRNAVFYPIAGGNDEYMLADVEADELYIDELHIDEIQVEDKPGQVFLPFEGEPGYMLTPPQAPDAEELTKESAHKLCQDYIKALYSLHSITDPEVKVIWGEFWKILKDIQSKYGTSKIGEAQPAEVLYAASIFFSLEKPELDKFLKTKKLRKEYELLKVSAEGILNAYADPEVFRFSEMRQFFACDFSYIRRIVSALDAKEETVPIPEDEIEEGLLPEYNVILLMVKIAGKCVYFSGENSDKKRLEIPSILKYYRTKYLSKSGKASAKKDIDTIIDMRKSLRDRLKGKVKGQDMAIDKFVDGYIRYRIRGKVPGKPAGVYLFAGPPGTGKTYLAEVFAGLVADEGYQYKRFEMSAYAGEGGDNVTGLVGFERSWKSAQPGQLTDFVKKNPKCILLFDEIEKAGAKIRYLFLSVLEGAALTDRYYDEPVSFEDAILIFTTNEGRDLYEENRGTNLTSMSDSAVMDGLQASRFAPELISRFMSGTIIMFNHLSYFHMLDIFRTSVEAAVGQIRKNALPFAYHCAEEVPKLYLLSKGDNIDARFAGANAKKTAEDIFLEAMEYVKKQGLGSLAELKEIGVSVQVNDEVREYFEITQRPRILGYIRAAVSVGEGVCPQDLVKRREEAAQTADFDWAEDEKSFLESLQACNWNGRSREDKYDAVLIDLAGNSGDKPDGAGAGYGCLKAAVEQKRDIPIIVVDRGNMEDKSSLMALGVTDFVRGTLCGQQCMDDSDQNADGCGDWKGQCLVLDREELEAILARQHFVERAAALARKKQRLSGSVVYNYEKESGKLSICYTDLRIKAATEENAEARRQNRKYLLADKPQVRLQDIFGGELVKKAVRRCIDNIRNPEKYREAGAKLMKGILMYGAPGMGKTMFAKAMAYESGAAFISAVGSDFLNGNGIAKMEEMFQTARRKKPCILFIDEFDAISKNRYGAITSYQESVLEKFLKEMDGLETDNDGVYVVGATNYSLERLDSAVTRRFSARIYFPYPNKEERERFLLYIIEKKGLENRISERAAKTLNLMMYRKMRNYAEMETFIEESIAEALYQNVDVTERFLFNRIHDETDGAIRQEADQEKLMPTAFHEAGHAVLQYHFGMKNDYVTIVSRGDYGGYSMAQPKYYTGQDFLNQICIFLAGRAAEIKALELSSWTDGSMGINVGAESDLKKATQIAYDYVCRFGMGERLIVVPERFALLEGSCPEAVLPETEKEAIWTAVQQILEQQRQRTEQLLQDCWREVLALACSLIYMQELDGKTVEDIIQNKNPYIEESCFLDSDCDYTKLTMDGEETEVPFGYPVYPYSVIKLQWDEENITVVEDREYYYTVKKDKESLGIYGTLQEAFAVAFRNGAHCRRFQSGEAARAYQEMLELKAFRQGEKRFCGFCVDALTEMRESSAAEKYITVLRGDFARRLREQAAEAQKTMAQCLMESIERDLNEKEDVYIVVQIYDGELREELLCYMDALEEQAERYRRNFGK